MKMKTMSMMMTIHKCQTMPMMMRRTHFCNHYVDEIDDKCSSRLAFVSIVVNVTNVKRFDSRDKRVDAHVLTNVDPIVANVYETRLSVRFDHES